MAKTHVCDACGVNYWRTQTFDNRCGPCSGGTTTCTADEIAGMAPAVMDYARDWVVHPPYVEGAEQPNPEPPMNIPKTKVLHCTHCDRHHEAELVAITAASGALYSVECPATGRVVKEWVKPEEMWG